MKIHIEIVDNEEIKMRKGFGGADWWWEDDTLQIRVPKELPKKEAIALLMHEVAEALICLHLGIDVKDIDDYDLTHLEDERNPTFNSGDQPDAPYRIPHTYATAVERIFAGIFDIDWVGYDERLSKL
jgi:hypothetical protein